MLRVTNTTKRPLSTAAQFGTMVYSGGVPYVFCFKASYPDTNEPVPYVTYFGSLDGGKTNNFYTCPADEFDRTFTEADGNCAPALQNLLGTIFNTMAQYLKTGFQP